MIFRQATVNVIALESDMVSVHYDGFGSSRDSWYLMMMVYFREVQEGHCPAKFSSNSKY